MLADRLADDYGLIVEMASVSYIICISSVVDSDERYDILFKAMDEIDRELCSSAVMSDHAETDIVSGRNSVMAPGIAWDKPMVSMPLKRAAGSVSGAFVYAYPPGIPVLAPGEIIDQQAVDGICSMIECGLHVAGVNDGCILVLRRE